VSELVSLQDTYCTYIQLYEASYRETLEVVLDAIIKGGTIPPAVNQCGMSVGAHNSSTFGSDRTTLERCRDRGVTYQAYSPLGGLSGVDILRNPTVEAVAARHHASTATVALRWLVQQGVPFVTSSTKAGYDLEDLSTRVVGNRSGALWLSDAEMALLATV
jgi:diketogulonate reductase-like aldo/keto reductase